MAEASSNFIPEAVKKYVRAVLLSQIGGVSLKRFPSDYNKLIGENFPMRSLGFSSLLTCMQAMPDVVRIIGDNLETCTLLGIGDETSFMSGPAIAAQYPVAGTEEKRHRSQRKMNKSHKKVYKDDKNVNKNVSTRSNFVSSDSKKFPNLVANQKGLYAIVVKGIKDLNTAHEVYRLFSTEALIVSQSACSRLYFYRFASIVEAEKIITKYDGSSVIGTTIRVSPAEEKFRTKNITTNASKPDSQSIDENLQNGENEKKPDKTKNITASSSSSLRPSSQSLDEKFQNGGKEKRPDRTKNTTESSSRPSSQSVDEKFQNGEKEKRPEIIPNLFLESHVSENVSSENISENSFNGTQNAQEYEGRKNTDKRGDKRKTKDTENYRNNSRTKDTKGRFNNMKQLSAQLEVIQRKPLLPKLPKYGIHLDNINKSTTEVELMNAFLAFHPLSCKLGKKRRNYADMIFKNIDSIIRVSEYLQHNTVMGEYVTAHLAYSTIKQLGLDHEEMGLNIPTNFTQNVAPDKFPYKEDLETTDYSDYPPGSNSCQSNAKDTDTGICMDSMLKSLPQSVNHEASPVSDSELSTSTRRRRPCILDILE
ncbi:uncharacterized protein [Antedon mediterranea]|uniref:uncharacterized protein n=1 Tax=Antedon mediterranea TaxID=105859 RepID=UPI003AF93A27